MPASARPVRAGVQLGGQAAAAVAGHRAPDLGERLAADRLDVGRLRAAALGVARASRRTASALTTITDRVWPSRSCRSRENRSRSSATAACGPAPAGAAQLLDQPGDPDEREVMAPASNGDQRDRDHVVGRRQRVRDPDHEHGDDAAAGPAESAGRPGPAPTAPAEQTYISRASQPSDSPAVYATASADPEQREEASPA